MLTFSQYLKSHDIRSHSHSSSEDEEQTNDIPVQQDQNPGDIPPSPGEDQEQDLSAQQPEQQEDNDRQGLIRAVPGAHLVYKRRTEEGSFEELWIYHVEQKGLRTEYNVKKDILAGTDIPANQTCSDDQSQTCEVWTIGNAQLLHITGLPN